MQNEVCYQAWRGISRQGILCVIGSTFKTMWTSGVGKITTPINVMILKYVK